MLAYQEPIQARFYLLSGHVQGVGFRPFVYRLAEQCGVKGWVENRIGQVAIHAEADAQYLQVFQLKLIQQAPPHASPQFSHSKVVNCENFHNFTIRDSSTSTSSTIRIVPDLPVCESCLNELYHEADRRFHYPFINCTNCGPRYSIIRELPYDRGNTTMAGFQLCPSCQREYENPQERRFHAEPIACPECGPRLEYKNQLGLTANADAALVKCVQSLRLGNIVAVKGIGGYHLMCDAHNERAIKSLRKRKSRPHKPLAMMVPAHLLRRYVKISDDEMQLLSSSVHPIVLVRCCSSSTLPHNIAPGLRQLGVMLPYSPLHHLLLTEFGGPLIATSANISGEPVLTGEQEVEQRLHRVCDAYLHHNRSIQRPADDPVTHVVDKKARPLRSGRGTAPVELTLPFRLSEPTLAVGGHMKNTIALAWDDRVVISPHIGDLDSLKSQQVFRQVIEDLQRLYGVVAHRVLCDAHPDYNSSRWARRSGLWVHPVYHHHAHAAVLAGENPTHKNWLVFTWDGTGLGVDNSLWGGEALIGYCGHWRRIGSMRPFFLPGGNKASMQIWRSAASLCWESGFPWQFAQNNIDMLQQAWKAKINCFQSSSVGRIFDAAACMMGLVSNASFDGQGPMLLEDVAYDTPQVPALGLPLYKDSGGIMRTDWSPLLPMLIDTNLTLTHRASCFHESMAHALLQQALHFRQEFGDFVVGLSGGVFQNKLLSERVLSLLTQNEFRVFYPQRVAVNDGGLCFGQIMEIS